MNLLNEYKELYCKEIEHSDRLNNKISNSIAFITLIGSGNLLIWQKYFTREINTVYLLLCFTSLLMFVVTFLFFIRAYSGYDYAYFPTADMNQKIQQTLNITNGIKDGKTIADNHIQGMFERTYIKCANLDFEQNLIKNKRHKMFTTASVVSFLALAVAYIFNISVIENIHL